MVLSLVRNTKMAETETLGSETETFKNFLRRDRDETLGMSRDSPRDRDVETETTSLLSANSFF